MRLARAVALLLAGTLVAVATPARAFHTVFHFQVDRFELDRDVTDDELDFVDEFDGDSLGPWTHLYGTVSVSDGVLHLQNPGEHFGVGFPVDVSEVVSFESLGVHGDRAVITSSWMPPTMTPGSSLHMTLWLRGSVASHHQFIGVHVSESNGAPGIGLHVLETNGAQWKPLHGEGVPFDASAVVDRLVLRLVVENGTVTVLFSLDGGVTFENHALVASVLPSMTGAVVMLGADPAVANDPWCGNDFLEEGEACDMGRLNGRTGCCTGSCTLIDADADGVCDSKDACPVDFDPAQLDGDGDGLGDACDTCTTTIDGQRRWGRALVDLGRLNDNRTGNESLRIAGSFALPPDTGAVDPIATGARLMVRSMKDGSRVEIALPGGAYAAPGPGWEGDGTRFVFRDRRPGGTQGVRKMVVRRDDRGRVRLALAAPRGSFELGAWSFPPIHAAVAFGESGDACAEIRFAQRACAYPGSRRIVCR